MTNQKQDDKIVVMKENVGIIWRLDCDNADPHNTHEWTDENGNHYCYGIYREEMGAFNEL